jgi:hypothetical protein
MAPVFYYGLRGTDLSSDPEIKTDTETGSPERRSAQLPESKNFSLDVLDHKKAAKSCEN